MALLLTAQQEGSAADSIPVDAPVISHDVPDTKKVRELRNVTQRNDLEAAHRSSSNVRTACRAFSCFHGGGLDCYSVNAHIKGVMIIPLFLSPPPGKKGQRGRDCVTKSLLIFFTQNVH